MPTSFGPGPILGVPQSHPPQQTYAAPHSQQPTGLTTTSSDTSLGLTTFIAGLDTTGISPLTFASAAPTAPSAAAMTAPVLATAATTATTTTTAVAATGPALTALDQAAQDAVTLAKATSGPDRVLAKYVSVIDLVDDAKNNEFISTGGRIVFIPIGDLNADAVQHMRKAENMPPDPTLQRMIDAAVAAHVPQGEKVKMPDPHQEFSHDIWKFIRQQVHLRLYTEPEADAWWDENQRWTTRM